ARFARCTEMPTSSDRFPAEGGGALQGESPAKTLLRPGEAVGRLAGRDQLRNLPVRSGDRCDLATLIAGDVSHLTVRPNEDLLGGRWNVDGARDLHGGQIDYCHLVCVRHADDQILAIVGWRSSVTRGGKRDASLPFVG